MSFQQNHSRRFLPPGANRKRKERNEEGAKAAPFNGFKPPAPKPPKPQKRPGASQTTPKLMSSNHLLAGYLAHEYLTKGSLLGQKVDRLLTNAGRPMAEAMRGEAAEERKGTAEERYLAVAGILKTEGAYIPGIVNPTQLGNWIQM